MASHRPNPHPRTTPRWASKSLNRARALERRVEYHWPFVAYSLLSFATGGYIIIQLRAIC
jgi:hypothetical protein